MAIEFPKRIDYFYIEEARGKLNQVFDKIKKWVGDQSRLIKEIGLD